MVWIGAPEMGDGFQDQARLSGLDDVADGVKLALVEHQESLERLCASEPPSSTPEDFGRSSADDSVMLSEDALALRFAETNSDTLRFVAVWPRWFEWTTNRWRADEKLHAMSLARVTCRQAAGEAQ